VLAVAVGAKATNLVENGTFTTGTSGWTSYGAGLQLMWTDQDASGSSSSGSALATASDNNTSNKVYQCVASGIFGGGSYDISAKLKIPGYAVVAGTSSLYLTWREGPSCGGANLGVKTYTTYLQDTWVTLSDSGLIAPEGAQSVEVAVTVVKTGSGGVYHTYVDDVVLDTQAFASVVQHLFLPAAAVKHGLNGTYWTTEGWFANRSSEIVLIDGAFLRPGADNSAAVANPTSLGSLAPWGFLRLTDLVGKLGGNEETGGVYLRARATGAVLPYDLIAATSYTFTPNDQGPGNYGQGIPPVSTAGFITQLLGGVFQNSSLRTNIGAINTSSTTVTVDVTVRNPNGAQVGTTSWTLPPYSQIQVSISSLGISNLDGGSVLFQGSSGSYHAYSSTVDQLTGDAVYNATN